MDGEDDWRTCLTCSDTSYHIFLKKSRNAVFRDFGLFQQIVFRYAFEDIYQNDGILPICYIEQIFLDFSTICVTIN